jgi:hypothetical protein
VSKPVYQGEVDMRARQEVPAHYRLHGGTLMDHQERRADQRYYVKKRIFAVVCSNNHQLDHIEKMSKGEIAFAVIKSMPPKMGEITEISRGGLSFAYIENETDLSQFTELDILFTDETFHLSRLPFLPVGDTDILKERPFQALLMKRQAIKFNNLSFQQQLKLEHMIKNFTTGEVSPRQKTNKCGVVGPNQCQHRVSIPFTADSGAQFLRVYGKNDRTIV